jgi:hypothetical protein
MPVAHEQREAGGLMMSGTKNQNYRWKALHTCGFPGAFVILHLCLVEHLEGGKPLYFKGRCSFFVDAAVDLGELNSASLRGQRLCGFCVSDVHDTVFYQHTCRHHQRSS